MLGLPYPSTLNYVNLQRTLPAVSSIPIPGFDGLIHVYFITLPSSVSVDPSPSLPSHLWWHPEQDTYTVSNYYNWLCADISKPKPSWFEQITTSLGSIHTVTHWGESILWFKPSFRVLNGYATGDKYLLLRYVLRSSCRYPCAIEETSTSQIAYTVTVQYYRKSDKYLTIRSFRL